MKKANEEVAPLVGAWIEINGLCDGFYAMKSLLSWERGLKFDVFCYVACSCKVAPLVGAWIEILLPKYLYLDIIVAPLVGAWIEIRLYVMLIAMVTSLLSWERGLK